VHRGTVRALLSAGGFVQYHGRWCTAPGDEAAARTLRAAIVAALVQEEQSETFRHPSTSLQRLRNLAQAIHARLSDLIRTWRKMPSNNTWRKSTSLCSKTCMSKSCRHSPYAVTGPPSSSSCPRAFCVVLATASPWLY
jgi:hypothetical protein